jgi:ribosomal protein S18 acetylase RimI-like enzyme
VGRLYVEEWPSQFRIIDIALLPEARGKGFGAALIADLFAGARAVGKRVSIHVEKNNPAMRLYHRLGFAEAEDKGVYDLLEWSPEQHPD